MVLLLARGIEDDDFWVVDEIAGMLIETAWRLEHEDDGYRLGHATTLIGPTSDTRWVRSRPSFCTHDAAGDRIELE